MQPLDIQAIGTELAVRWDNGRETFVPLERLRRACPCAGCKGETDVLGNVYKNPARPLTAKAFELVKITSVGGYAIRLLWADGHDAGLFSFDYLFAVMSPA